MPDGSRAAGAVVGPPGDAGLERRVLLTREEQRGAVEENPDPPPRAEQLEPPEDLQAVDPLLAAQPVQRFGEPDAHRVGRPAADVLEHEEEQAVLELEIEDHVRLAAGAAVLRGGSGHASSLSQRHAEHLEHAAPLRDLAVPDVGAAHPPVEPCRVGLGLPFQPACAAFTRLVGDALEEPAAEALADPRGLDPEIFQPADLAAWDQRGPADGAPVRLGDEEQALAKALGLEVAGERPLLDQGAVVTPVSLRVDRDLAQPLEVGLGSLTDANAERLRP